MQIFTLKQVVSSIRKTIEERYQAEYWVKAEMHKLGQTKSGHCYPELLEKENGKIVAEIRGIIWKHNFDRINQRFIQVVKEPLKEDTTLLMKVKINFHEIYGISLQIQDIDPNYALGELHRERLETLRRLKKEGLINANQQLSFPLLPKRIAVISADSSKGLSDFMKVLNENEWGYSFFTMLFPAYLQGDQATSSIVAQLESIKKVMHHFDIVVIVRGGGGEVGMSCYNEYELCKNIASFPLPVLTGIGHSTNLTVAEMISFRNAITPTELGDFLLQAFHNFSVPLKDAAKSIRVSSVQLLKEANYDLSSLTASFHRESKQRIQSEKHSVVSASDRLVVVANKSIEHEKRTLISKQEKAVSGSKYLLQDQDNLLQRLFERLPERTYQSIERATNDILRLETSIKLLDPINVLNRGYSITTFNGKTLSEKNVVEPGDKITTRTANFTLQSEVTKKSENDE